MQIPSFFITFRSIGGIMYEPKYLPSLDQSLRCLSDIRFSIINTKNIIYRDDPGIEPLHVHNYLEIFFNNSSDVSFIVNNALFHVPAGSAVVSRPGDIHMCIFPETAEYDYFCLWVDTDRLSPLFSPFEGEDFRPLYTFSNESRSDLRGKLFSLLNTCEQQASELERLSLLLNILTSFAGNGTKIENDPTVPDALRDILDDIGRNFSELRGVSDIVSRHFTSPATLTRWFRKYLHTSPREYLESVKLSNAATLLSGGASVTEACMRSGFSDCSHFIVLFKRKFGQTPLRYKNPLSRKK